MNAVFLPNIPEPPVFTVKPESQDASQGSSVVIKSAFTGSAPLIVKWFRDEEEITSGGSYFIKKDASSSSLELNSVKPSDSSQYTCQVSNDAGKVDCTAVLFVKGACPENDSFDTNTCLLFDNDLVTSSLRTSLVCDEARGDQARHRRRLRQAGVQSDGQPRGHFQMVQGREGDQLQSQIHNGLH